MATIKYNILNLPDTVQHVNGHLLSNSYDATGDKFLAIHRTMNCSGVSMQAGWTYYNYPTGYTIASSTSRMYLDNSEYFSYNLDKILTDDGILVRTNDYSATTPVMGTNYFIRDHLGNVRVVFGDSGSIRQVNNYYPFGMEYGESAETLTELNYQNYLYGGKELDRKFGINAYDFTGRYYDLTDNRFWSMDPMAEKYYSISPYAYCLNNPVRFFDPDGREMKEAWNHLKKAGSVTVSLGFQVGFKFDVNKKGISGKINMLSMEFGGFEQGKKTLNVANPALSKEGSLQLGLFGGGVKEEVKDKGRGQAEKTTTMSANAAFVTVENKEATDYVENRNGTYYEIGNKSKTSVRTTVSSGIVTTGGVALGLGIEGKINWDEVAKAFSEVLKTITNTDKK